MWYNQIENTVSGYFFENNDFYRLIGKPPTKTLRSYKFDHGKINEILMILLPEENVTSDKFLMPIVEWAELHMPNVIARLYPDGEIVPSEENAKDWKRLIMAYRNQKSSN